MSAFHGEDVALTAYNLAITGDARLDAHEKICTERYQRIAGDTAEIKAAIQALSMDVKSAVQRIHERIDDEARRAREEARNALLDAENAHKNIAGLKVWVLSSAATVLLGIIGWFADHFWSRT